MIRYQTKITLAEIVKIYYFGIMIGIIVDVSKPYKIRLSISQFVLFELFEY